MILFAAICSNIAVAQNVNLELNLAKGETYSLFMITNSSIQQHIMDMDMNINMNYSSRVSYKVTDIIGSEYRMDVKYDSISMSMSMPTGELEYSSEKNDTNDIVSTMLEVMAQNPFHLKMTRKGKITGLSGLDSLYTAMMDRFPDMDEARKKQVMDQINNSYGEDAFTGQFEMVSAIFPDTAVGIGDIWVIKSKLQSMVSANMETTYELLEIQNGYNLIHGETIISEDDENAAKEINGVKMDFKINGTMTSSMKINATTGWVMESKIDQDLIFTSSFDSINEKPEGMSLEMKMKSVMTISE